MSEYERHHLVPRFYLENFAKKGKSRYPQLSTIDINRNKIYPENVLKASVRTGFYDLDVSSFEINFINNDSNLKEFYLGSKTKSFKKSTFENILGTYETAVSPILSKTINYRSWPLNMEDRSTLSNFLALQHLRGLKTAQRFKYNEEEFKKEILTSTKSDYYKNNPDIPKRVLDDFFSKKEAVRNLSFPTGHILMNSLLEEMPLIAKEISHRSWSLVVSSEEKFFTSDEPLSLSSYISEDIKDSEFLIFPISRNIFIMMESLRLLNLKPKEEMNKKILLGHFDRTLISSDTIFDSFEFHMIANAHEYIFLHPETHQKDQKRIMEKLHHIKSLK